MKHYNVYYIYSIKSQKNNLCIVLFYTVDFGTYRLVQTVTKFDKKMSSVVRKMW